MRIHGREVKWYDFRRRTWTDAAHKSAQEVTLWYSCSGGKTVTIHLDKGDDTESSRSHRAKIEIDMETAAELGATLVKWAEEARDRELANKAKA